MTYKYKSKHNISIAHKNGAVIFTDRYFETTDEEIAHMLDSHWLNGKLFERISTAQPKATDKKGKRE